MDIFLLCRSACCANGHLRVVTPCRTDGGPAALCVDRCVALDHDIFGVTFLRLTEAATNGRTAFTCSGHFGVVLNGDVLRISTTITILASTADTGSGHTAVCCNISMALDGDIAAFCAIAAADAGSIAPKCVF